MKRITALLLALVVTGCATHQAAPQAYRAKGQDNQTIITGKADRKLTDTIHIYFDNEEYISGKMEFFNERAELTGKPYNGKHTSASCNGTDRGGDWTEIRCIVFIDNERAATLTF